MCNRHPNRHLASSAITPECIGDELCIDGSECRRAELAVKSAGPVTFTVPAGTASKTIILKADEEEEIYRAYFPGEVAGKRRLLVNPSPMPAGIG